MFECVWNETTWHEWRKWKDDLLSILPTHNFDFIELPKSNKKKTMDTPLSEFTLAQATTFFEDFLRVDAFTRQRLADDGISNPEDLFHFNPDMIKQVDRNLRKPNGEMADPAPNAAANARVPIPAISLSTI